MKYDWSDYTILVAEDDPINFKFLQLLFEKHSRANVIWAKNGIEAYEKIINFFGVDLVLMDFQLPELNGLEVLLHSKKVRPKLPVVMQTANTWDDEIEQCFKAGCDGFFPKPLNTEDLLEHLDKLLKEYASIKMEQAI